MEFRDKTVLITGGASGIGAQVAAAFTKEGARVWLADLDLESARERSASLIGVTGIKLDVTSPDDWESAAADISHAGETLDVLVNAAGIAGGGPKAGIADVSLDSWRQVFSVNVDGALLGCQMALRAMHNGGAIVNFCSIVAARPTPTLAAYGASKAALEHLTKTIASHCGAHNLGIRCNAVMPGMVDTPMIAGMHSDYQANWLEKIPAHRFARVSEVSDLVLFLAGDRSAYISGTSVLIDGGYLSRPLID